MPTWERERAPKVKSFEGTVKNRRVGLEDGRLSRPGVNENGDIDKEDGEECRTVNRWEMPLPAVKGDEIQSWDRKEERENSRNAVETRRLISLIAVFEKIQIENNSRKSLFD